MHRYPDSGSTRPMMNRLLSLLLLLAFTGCQNARSFLHMDSNSSSPFMGLQLSVDASDVHLKRNATGRTAETRTASLVRSEFEGERTADLVSNSQTVAVQETSAFVVTSETSRQTGSLKYSLPAIDLQAGDTDAGEVDEIISRFPGS